MSQGTLSFNRTVIGAMAVVCGIASAGLLYFSWKHQDNSGLIYTQGGLARIGLVLGALWLAMPNRNREAAWANISPKFLALLVGVALVMVRVQLKFLLPAAVVLGVFYILLRPRPKRRPNDSY